MLVKSLGIFLLKSKDDGRDRQEGDEISNNIFGGLGSDFIDWGEGEDFASFASNFDDFQLKISNLIKKKRYSCDKKSKRGAQGNTLKNVEYISILSIKR